MTLGEAFSTHQSDWAWLQRNGTHVEDWDTEVEVTHWTNGIDDEYLGDDGETVFQVFGQSEPRLACDAALWKICTQHHA